MYWKVVITLFAAGFAVGLTTMVGAPIDANIKDQDVKDALQFAVVQYNQGSNDVFLSQVARVVKVQKQVVAGIKYIFKVQMGKTSCRKGSSETVCSVLQAQDPQALTMCTFAVWTQPWSEMVKMVENHCK